MKSAKERHERFEWGEELELGQKLHCAKPCWGKEASVAADPPTEVASMAQKEAEVPAGDRESAEVGQLWLS